MNEDLILQVVKPLIKNSSLSYEDFDRVFHMLSLKEQYAVTGILYRNGIELCSSDEGLIEEEKDIVDYSEDVFEEKFETENNSVDTTRHVVEREPEILKVNKVVKQSNEVLCKLIQKGSKQAEQDLCVKNKRLVDKVVVRYQNVFGHGLEFEDLEQVGFQGLLKAAKRFDTEKGFAFSTYAMWWIKQTILREICENGFTIRIPVHMMEKIYLVSRTEQKYMYLTLKERISSVATYLGWEEEKVRDCILLRENYIKKASLNAPAGDSETEELEFFIRDDKSTTVDQEVERNELRRIAIELMDTLSPKECDILKMRYGFYDDQPHTLEEIGQKYNLTRERIRQIEERALRKLRVPKKSNRISGLMD